MAGFLWFGAGQSLRSAELASRTEQLDLDRLIRPSVYLPGTVPVSEAMRCAAETRTSGIVVIDGDGRSRAIVDESEVAKLGYRQRPWTTLAEVSRPLQHGLILRDDLSGGGPARRRAHHAGFGVPDHRGRRGQPRRAGGQ